jgi:hypothetical protein
MDNRQQYILKLEQDAGKLVNEIGALKKEVTSYKTATEELDKARASIMSFLEETQKLSQQTHKLLATLNEIGSAQISNQLVAVANRGRTGIIVTIIGFIVVLSLEIVLLRRLH